MTQGWETLRQECARIKFQCWLQRMAAARFMDNLELYQEGEINREEILCFMPKYIVNNHSLMETKSSTVDLVSIVEYRSKPLSASTTLQNTTKAA